MPLDVLASLLIPSGAGKRALSHTGHLFSAADAAVDTEAAVFSAQAAAADAAVAAAKAAAAVAGRPSRWTSFVSMGSLTIGAGEPLPTECYANPVGQGQLPQLMLTDAPKGSKYFVVLAQDADDPEANPLPPPGGPARLLWCRVNIPLEGKDPETHEEIRFAQDLGGMDAVRAGATDVVPYNGVVIRDDFIHRIFWRIFALKERVPDHVIQGGWPRIYQHLEKLDMFRPQHKVGDKGEFMTIAVRREDLDPQAKAREQQRNAANSNRGSYSGQDVKGGKLNTKLNGVQKLYSGEGGDYNYGPPQGA